jgi:hypothetical protein
MTYEKRKYHTERNQGCVHTGEIPRENIMRRQLSTSQTEAIKRPDLPPTT